MAIVVEHEKRRRDILDKAIDVFIDEGYEDATFQKIADRCGITRTTLYIYFRNKKDIFNYSIKQMLEQVEENLLEIKEHNEYTSDIKIKKMLLTIIGHLQSHRKLLIVIHNYLLYISKSGTDPDKRVRQRTLRLRHILAGVFIEGIEKGEVPKVKVRTLVDTIFNFIDASIYRLVVLRRESTKDIEPSIDFTIKKLICASPNTDNQ